MASLHYCNLTVHLGYHSLSEQQLINYYLRMEWNNTPLINPAICENNMAGSAFLFTLHSFDPEDYLLSFWEQLLEKRADAMLYNTVESDLKIRVYTWSGRVLWLKAKYGDTINVGQGVEPFETGIKKLTEKNKDNIELVFRIPQYHFSGGAPERDNWINNQYVIFAVHSNLQQVEKLLEDLKSEFEAFKAEYPQVDIRKEEYYDPFG